MNLIHTYEPPEQEEPEFFFDPDCLIETENIEIPKPRDLEHPENLVVGRDIPAYWL